MNRLDIDAIYENLWTNSILFYQLRISTVDESLLISGLGKEIYDYFL
jgi:hypothetical protein